MRALLVLLALSTPAFADRTPTLSFGIGPASHRGPLATWVGHASVGARIAERDWITASYGYIVWPTHGDELITDERLWEITLAASRMWCSPGSRGCWVFGLGGGYQSVGKYHGDDGIPLPGAPPPEGITYDQDNLLAEGRVAGRLRYDYVWLEASLALRVHAQLDPSSAGSDVMPGLVFGIMLHVTP